MHTHSPVMHALLVFTYNSEALQCDRGAALVLDAVMTMLVTTAPAIASCKLPDLQHSNAVMA